MGYRIDKPRVFLGGTCNSSTWREELIPMLEIGYFNPVVEDWNESARVEEILQRQECDYLLYVITSEMAGVYSIAEVVDDSNKRPEKTLLCVLLGGFTEGQIKSLDAVMDMVRNNGGTIFYTLEGVAEWLNIRGRI